MRIDASKTGVYLQKQQQQHSRTHSLFRFDIVIMVL